MTKDALITLGLTEEQTEKVLEFYTEALKDFVPKEKLIEMETEKEQLSKSIKERDKQLEELRTAAGATDELKKQLEEAIAKNKNDSEQAAIELAEYKKDNAVNIKLLKFGAKNPIAVKALLDLSKVSLDGKNLIGIDDQLDELKASDAYLFDTVQNLTGREAVAGGAGRTGADELKDNPFKKETWNLTKQGQLLKENPELYKKLQAAAARK